MFVTRGVWQKGRQKTIPEAAQAEELFFSLFIASRGMENPGG